ncbi:YdcF family protein [Arthrobacter sp. NPDC090010]|uniref:YdcF family protein n=1 Tax=Arthrobacter sp. NPDC090010 TaxID=3363942 RepID=UPI0038262668
MDTITRVIAENITTVLAAVFALAGAFSIWRDRRRLRNGVFLLLAFGFALLSLGRNDETAWILLLSVLLALLAVPVLGVFLVVNGIMMLRREGRSLANLLSLAVGLLVLFAPMLLGALGRVTSRPDAPTWLSMIPFLIFVLVAYVGFVFSAFLVYSFVYARTRSRQVPDYVIILGSGLIGGKVPPLLAGRLDKAIQIYQRSPADSKPVLIPSGGQGPDESRSEGEAMAEYLRDAGIPSTEVLTEPRARTTMENLEFSRALMTVPDPAITVATSSYHVFRAAMYTRRAGMKAIVRGSRTAAYFVPSAFLREFIAVFLQYKWINLGVCLAIVLGFLALLWESNQGL